MGRASSTGRRSGGLALLRLAQGRIEPARTIISGRSSGR